jgi:hypothetical protein
MKQVPNQLALRIFLYWNFAFLLSEVIEGIKPPMWKGGDGILSYGMLSQGSGDTPANSD